MCRVVADEILVACLVGDALQSAAPALEQGAEPQGELVSAQQQAREAQESAELQAPLVWPRVALEEQVQ